MSFQLTVGVPRHHDFQVKDGVVVVGPSPSARVLSDRILVYAGRGVDDGIKSLRQGLVVGVAAVPGRKIQLSLVVTAFRHRRAVQRGQPHRQRLVSCLSGAADGRLQFQLRPLVCGQSGQGSAYRKRCCQQGRCHFREPSHDKLSSFPFCRSDIGSIRASTTVRASVYSPEQVAIARNCAPSGSSSSARRACASI